MLVSSARTIRGLVVVPFLVIGAVWVSGPGRTEDTTHQDTPEPAGVQRLRLFDGLESAEWRGVSEEQGAASEVKSWGFDFEDATPERWWWARPEGRGLSYEAGEGSLPLAGGLGGRGLSMGSAELPDTARIVTMLPGEGLARVIVRGRVRLEGNSLSDEGSMREVFRVVEREAKVDDPSRLSRWQRDGTQHRVSRRLDPSGWDHFEHEFISGAGTRTLELQFLHRSDGSGDSITRFDDLEVESQVLSPTAIVEHLRGRYAPRDGRRDTDSGRVRIELSATEGRRTEARDAVFLVPPTAVAFGVDLPAAGTAPVLRFHYGMTREAQRAPGDGARLEVRFEAEGRDPVLIGAVDFDPKNERRDRTWLQTEMSLGTVAGQSGKLVFHSLDVEGSEVDALDTVVLSTPRIEPSTEIEGADAADAGPVPYNLLLIGVDTVRADHLSAFGYERDTTPNLKALADVGVRFSSTRSQAPWTLPSFSSIHTSMYPSAHGAGRGGHDEWTPIDPSTTALSEVLSRVGFETQGIVANGLISPHYGLDQGFEGYQYAWAMESVERDAPSVANWVQDHGATPWFLFWHIMDPHLPYSTTQEDREAFTDEAYDGRFASRRSPSVPFQVLDPRPGRRWYTHEGPPPPPDLTEADARFVSDYYDAELHETDAAIGRVLEAIRRSGQWDRTIIAFVADHGEGLGDHGHYHHGYTLFDDQVHIPMILRIPGQHEGVEIDRPVAAIDLAPTILGAMGLPIPTSFQGVDRLAEDAPTDDAYVIEYPTYDSSAQKGWVSGRFKYLHDPVFHTEALYDFVADPGELVDVAAEHPEVVARARRELDAFRWQNLQKGRFHLRLKGKPGQRLTIHVTTDDLFDANFISKPAYPERAFEMDLARRNLQLDVELSEESFEFIFWGRGNVIGVDVRLDGEPLEDGLVLPPGETRGLPLQIERSAIPTAEGDDLYEIDRDQGLFWREAGVAPVLPVMLTPEELELLRELGYTR